MPSFTKGKVLSQQEAVLNFEQEQASRIEPNWWESTSHQLATYLLRATKAHLMPSQSKTLTRQTLCYRAFHPVGKSHQQIADDEWHNLIRRRILGGMRFFIERIVFYLHALNNQPWRCCQTNSNQSLLGQSHCPLSCANTTPLGKCGGAVVLEVISAV